MINEIYKDIIGFEDIYSISNFGKVKSKIRRGWKGKKNSFIKHFIQRRGYPVVFLYPFEGKRSIRFVHSLVAEHFIGKRPKGFDVNHKDGNKTNNYFKNLEYLSHSENMLHSYKIGLQKGMSGENNPSCKINLSIARKIKEFLKKPNMSMREFARTLNIPHYIIYNIKNKNTWKCA